MQDFSVIITKLLLEKAKETFGNNIFPVYNCTNWKQCLRFYNDFYYLYFNTENNSTHISKLSKNAIDELTNNAIKEHPIADVMLL